MVSRLTHESSVVIVTAIAAASFYPYTRLVDLLDNLQSEDEGIPLVSRSFDRLGIVSAILTCFSLPAMVAVDFVIRGFFTSFIAVEFAWLGAVLWGFWIATTVLTVNAAHTLSPVCGLISDIPDIAQTCPKIHLAEALSIIMCIIVPLYPIGIILLSFTMRSKMSLSSMWFSSVREIDN
ncbi:hypothetical protein NM688_g4531 [Phlebia brevispora]|uniref:Uncharacterized protein n=1 Tax=Phlebia brevispora TaxID=194682 RepID=A0ACC1T2N5_9APHY|nr:hypothetical protein NM688_g4531 [Phlebia brevispora]